jgi:hypothetical protein
MGAGGKKKIRGVGFQGADQGELLLVYEGGKGLAPAGNNRFGRGLESWRSGYPRESSRWMAALISAMV